VGLYRPMKVNVSLFVILKKRHRRNSKSTVSGFLIDYKLFFAPVILFMSDDLLLSPLSEHMQKGAPPEEARSAHPNSSPIGKV
jgi:hypothetical protein